MTRVKIGRWGSGPAVVVVALAAAIAAQPAGAFTDGPYGDVYYVNSCATSASVNSAPIFSGSPSGIGVQTPQDCASISAGLQITAQGGASNGANGKWSTITPTPAMRIVGVNAFGLADCNLHSDGFQADYFYGDNGVNYGVPPITIDCHGALGNGSAGNFNGFIQPSRYFGFQASCGESTCRSSGVNSVVFAATGITLAVQETAGPALNAVGAENLYYQSGWVRGTFPASLSASDPSGVCSMQGAINGKAISGYIDPRPDTSTWSQCPGSGLPATVDTTGYPNGTGAISLSYAATNAAGATSSASRSIDVDNQTPSVNLSGPSDAPSTAGTQYVTAAASAGPSGIASIQCSVDGAAAQAYPGATAQVPVSGLGPHVVSCFAQNRAVNANGQPAQSPTATFDLSIRRPTAAAVTFARIADALRCRRVTEKVKVHVRRRTVKRHGKRIVVPGHLRTVKRVVRRCHAKTVRRRVTITVRRHGRRVKIHKVERVVLLPHAVRRQTLRIAHGKATTVSGYVGFVDGTPLSGGSVAVLAAPDNGLGRFVPMANVTTNADGQWSARVPAGPSRLIEAVYNGDSTTEPTVSATAQLIVPAKIGFSISPRILPWSHAIHIVGHLEGGEIPRDGVALRLLVRYARSPQASDLLAFRTNRRGQFKIGWSYRSGHGVAAYPFWVATTATETDYAFAAASSRHVTVTFGRQTPRRPRHHQHKG
jgi:hypothetical protein